MGLKLSNLGLKMSYIGLKLNYMGLNLSYIGLELSYMGLKLTHTVRRENNYNYIYLCHSGLRGCRGQNSFDNGGYTYKPQCSMLELILIITCL